MKGERRHELERNLLADWIASKVEQIKPYRNAILGVVLLAVVAFGVSTWMTRLNRAKAETAWDELYTVMMTGTNSPTDFEEVAQRNAGTTTAHWANVLGAEIYLARACNELFSRKDVARDDLEKADELLRRVLDECRIDRLRARATFGLAQVHESQGDLEKAIESWSSPSAKKSGQKADRGYQGVVNLWPDGMFGMLAKKRLDDLEKPSTLAFYDRFANWEPKSPVADEPGTPGLRPPTELTLPEEPLMPSGTPSDTEPPMGLSPSSGFPQPDLEEKPAPKSDTPQPPAAEPEAPKPESDQPKP